MLGRVTTLSDTAEKIRQRHTEMCSILPEVTEMPGKVIKKGKKTAYFSSRAGAKMC